MPKKVNPFISEVDATSFYSFPALKQRLDLIRQIISDDSRLILILGETGSGKTLMMKQILAEDTHYWKGARVNAQEDLEPGVRMMEHQAYLYRKNDLPVMMMDDAHKLLLEEMAFLIRLTGADGGQRQIDKLVLFSDYSIMSVLTELSGMLPEDGAIAKIFMPPLSRQETETYIYKYLASVGLHRKELFSPYEIDIVYEATGGNPGAINHESSRIFDQKMKEGGPIKRFLRNFF